jgi:hypothetical protein
VKVARVADGTKECLLSAAGDGTLEHKGREKGGLDGFLRVEQAVTVERASLQFSSGSAALISADNCSPNSEPDRDALIAFRIRHS